jgi:tetratricopeptide (TPR) repeat protein
MQPVNVLSVDSLSEAQLIEAATREPIEDPRMEPSQRAVQRLNHARALVFLAMRNGDFDRLIDALPLLRGVLQNHQLDPAVALLAARDLMEAQALLVQHGGDDDRYRDAIELFAELARENPNVPDAQPVLHEHRAGYQQCVLSAAMQDLAAAMAADDQIRADQARGQLRDAWFGVERELRTARQLASDNAPVIPEFLIMLGAHLCTAVDCLGEYRSDEGVELCRQALALRSGRTRHQRPRSELYLAQCLVFRYEQLGDEGDLNEAEPLAQRLVSLGNPIEARARQVLLKIATLRAETIR